MAIGNLPIGQSSGSISVDTLVKTGAGAVLYLYPTASSSGIVAIYDGTSTAGTNLTGSITLTAATRIDLNLGFGTGLWVELVSGTATFYVSYV